MTANPLKSVQPGLLEKRRKLTPQEHCDNANRRLAENGINEERRAHGLPPVRWVVRDRQVKIEATPGNG